MLSITAAVLLTVWGGTRLLRVSVAAPTATLTLQGRVYKGQVGLEPPNSQALEGVVVSAYGGGNPYPDPGVFIISTTTNSSGWYGLDVPDTGYEYYHIIETDPAGHASVGATTVSGTVRTSNWIEYSTAVLTIGQQILTGNKFWARLDADIVAESLVVAPGSSRAGETVLLTATVRNTGTFALDDVPVRFAADGVPFDTRVVSHIPAGDTVEFTTTQAFSETGIINLTAMVDPDEELYDLDPDNNIAFATLEVYWEENPGWARPDLALSDLNFVPHRPGNGDPVEVAAHLSNLSLNTTTLTATLVLLIDNVVVDEQVWGGFEAGEVVPITITWPSATPGRHTLELAVDPVEGMDERSDANNHLYEWIRVEGDPDPLPDLEVEHIHMDLPSPNVGDTTLVAVEVCNEGYSDTVNVPVLLTLDGHELAHTIIETLPQGACQIVETVWADIAEGEHLIGAWIDPEDIVADDSVRARDTWAVVVTGAEYKLAGTGSPTPWKFIGPDTINSGAYVGRIDSVAVSRQNTDTIVLGANAGGVWLTQDGGQNWSAQADHLPSSGFPIVAFDPSDDDIIYAATGSSLWGGGTGLYKSTDSGAHWSTFAGTWLGNGYGALIVTYTQPSSLTIYAATDSGVWMWQGDKDAEKTASSEWEHVWVQQQAGLTSKVTDMILTAEPTPKLYAAVFQDVVYWITATHPISTAWTRQDTGLPTNINTIRLGNSPADANGIYAAVKRLDGQLEIYYSGYAGDVWTWRSSPSAIYGTRDTNNAFIAVNPANADVLYIGGMRGWRSTDGGVSFNYTIPSVHDDYKSYAFDPHDSSTVYFVSDGGIYRCTNDAATTMSCVGLNNNLGTTQFYDIALATTYVSRTVGGTQDNGTIISDGSTAWTNMAYGGDGRYVAIDPVMSNTVFAQYQHVNSVVSTTVAGKPWRGASKGLPSGTGDPFMIMHPNDGGTLLAAADQVYRTTNAGGLWSGIGPTSTLTYGNIRRIAIDATNNRYYAGTTGGEIWTVGAAQAGANTWTKIFTHTLHKEVRGLQVDPADANVIYADFSGQGTRIIKLTHSGGWPGAWAEADITGNLPSNRKLYGGPYDAVRGLLKDPSADVLYLGTDHGVYRGQPVSGSWQWFPDSCGLPLTFVSDLELHPTGGFMRAATFGRSAYERSVAQLTPLPDDYDTSTRNDTLATAAPITGEIVNNWFVPGLTVENLNMDRLNDMDYFTVQLPVSTTAGGYAECKQGLDPVKCTQGYFEIAIHAPNTPDPFELRLYNPDGSVFKEFMTQSNLTYKVECPHSYFPSGVITFSVRSPSGCQSEYDLWFWYSRWNCSMDAPDILFDPPKFRRLVPELGNLFWMFPGDPEMINQVFVGQAPEPLPEQRLIFHWDYERDFQATFDIEGSNLDVTLVNADGNPIANAGSLSYLWANALGETAVTSTRQINVADLPAGWYALDIGNGDFPTYFEIAFNALPNHISLPLVMRNF